jgi:hypothetical protein
VSAEPFLVGVLVGLFIGFAFGVGCTWRYWKEKIARDIFDKSKWN